MTDTVIHERPTITVPATGVGRPRWTVPEAAAPAGVLAAAVLGTALCVWAAAHARLDDITDLGLAPLLGWPFWAGLGLLNLAFIAGLCARRLRPGLLAVPMAGVVLAIYGAAPIASPVPRGQVAYRHLGIIANLAQSGHPDRTIDAYFSWPGYFAASASFFKSTGLAPLEVIRWAPVWNTVLWLAALGCLVQQLVRNPRHVWLAVWLFASIDWIDQDYFSPQAFAFLLLLLLLAMTLRWFRADPRTSLWRAMRAQMRSQSPTPAGSALGRMSQSRVARVAAAAWRWFAGRVAAEPDQPGVGRRAALLATMTVLVTAMVISHQLTPFALVASLALLVLAACTTAPRLPLIVGVIAITWLAYEAVPYLVGHPLASDLGDIKGLASTNLIDRMNGTTDHLTVQWVRIGLTAAVFALACLGAFSLRRRRGGLLRRPALALGIGPLLLLPLQSYGGEMLLRVTLYAAPIAAVFVASALLFTMLPSRLTRGVPADDADDTAAGTVATDGATPGPDAPADGEPATRPAPAMHAVPGWWRRSVIFAVCAMLGAAAVLSRYGNASFDMFRPGEIDAVAALYQNARPGDVLIAGARATPWRNQDYGAYRAVTIEDLCTQLDARACLDRIRSTVYRGASDRGLVLLTRSNRVALSAAGQMSPAQLDELENLLQGRPGARLLWENQDARIYELTRPARR